MDVSIAITMHDLYDFPSSKWIQTTTCVHHTSQYYHPVYICLPILSPSVHIVLFPSSFTSLSNSFDVKLHTADALSSNIGLIFQKKKSKSLSLAGVIIYGKRIWRSSLASQRNLSLSLPLLFSLYSVSSLRLSSRASHSHSLQSFLSSSAVLV